MSHSSDAFQPVLQRFADSDLITLPASPIKSGKEASVFRCHAHPRLDRGRVALKIYRPRAQRSFKNDAVYREGSMLERVGGGQTRAARALRSGTRFGREVQEFVWAAREWEVMQRLYAAGLPVPEPLHIGEGAILMDLFETPDGEVAAPLREAELSPGSAAWLYQSLCGDVEQMLWLDVLHGDLSPYNVLWNGETYRIIDFPQAIDPRFNGHAPRMLERDIGNIARFCEAFTEVEDPALTASSMWARFQRGERP